MKAFQRQERGFTLVEILVVVGLFGLVMTSVFSVYLTHMKNAYRQDDALETQQNLRIAMDAISRDLKMAGMLVPISGVNPISAGALGSYSSSVKITTASADGIYARVAKNSSTIIGYSNFSTNVDTADAVDGFQASDRVRLIRPFDNSHPLRMSTYTTLIIAPSPYTPNRAAPSLKVQYASSATFSAATAITPSDMFAKAAGAGVVDTIDYALSSASPCPTGMLCLTRTVNAAAGGSPQIVAYNLATLKFSYLFDDVSGTAETRDVIGASANPSNIKAVRVTITGIPAKGAALAGAKQLTTVVGLRNRRSF